MRVIHTLVVGAVLDLDFRGDGLHLLLRVAHANEVAKRDSRQAVASKDRTGAQRSHAPGRQRVATRTTGEHDQFVCIPVARLAHLHVHHVATADAAHSSSSQHNTTCRAVLRGGAASHCARSSQQCYTTRGYTVDTALPCTRRAMGSRQPNPFRPDQRARLHTPDIAFVHACGACVGAGGEHTRPRQARVDDGAAGDPPYLVASNELNRPLWSHGYSGGTRWSSLAFTTPNRAPPSASGSAGFSSDATAFCTPRHNTALQ